MMKTAEAMPAKYPGVEVVGKKVSFKMYRFNTNPTHESTRNKEAEEDVPQRVKRFHDCQWFAVLYRFKLLMDDLWLLVRVLITTAFWLERKEEYLHC